ncbi:ABC transporter ATP-binding protein [Sneathiella marina]|uniref:ABC transporter ATP-binding protein n=1 Tax=Sneathiella marina TaxID=2950108 RepID=A0ABY4W449_9PROT|nr:ABC transporter ATP-binding protein [Sneathiella marina]USG61606.1 ABC transporter ATP-binding protein [Sneathiella marina]
MADFDLELIKLSKTYPGGAVAVKEFDLEVERGEFVSFVGPSGCGKTTTLRMIAGLEDITSGKIQIRGEDVTKVPTEKRPTSTIFQNYAIFPHMTVRQNIEFGLNVRKMTTNVINKRVGDILEKLDLGDVANAKEESLSGGQKQRLALARSLVIEPEILLLDEPLGALDANLRRSIQEELKLLQRSLGITFIFVTHAQSEALSLSDRIVVMNAGEVEQISDPLELYTRPQTPFVAKFVGSNLIFPARFEAMLDENAAVSTDIGSFDGMPVFDRSSCKKGETVSLVIPSEFIDVFPSEKAIYKDNCNYLKGTLSEVDFVGRDAYLSIVLSNNQPIRLQSDATAIRSRNLTPGGPVDMQWRRQRATVVLGHA